LIENNKLSIYESLDLFTEKEVIESSGIKCDGCFKKAKFSKKYEIERTANYLIISLKRFKFNKM